MNGVRDRIFQIVKSKRLTVKAFEEATGAPERYYSALKAKKSGQIGVTKLQDIIKAFPDISAEWLLIGLGAMYREERGSDILTNGSMTVEGDNIMNGNQYNNTTMEGGAQIALLVNEIAEQRKMYEKQLLALQEMNAKLIQKVIGLDCRSDVDQLKSEGCTTKQ